MNLTICTATFGREELSKAVLSYYPTLDVPGVHISGVVGGWSKGKTYEANFGVDWWNVAGVANRPLGEKWNSIIRKSRQTNPDAVMIVGSDDLVSENWVAHVCELVASGVDLVGAHEFYMADGGSGQLRRLRLRTGAGRTFSRKLLDMMEWQLWTDDIDDGLDSDFDRNLMECGYTFNEHTEHDLGDYLILDIKDPSGQNVWSFTEMESMCASEVVHQDAKAWTERHFPGFQWPKFKSKIKIRI